jgi:hypothetical protein
MYESIAPRLYAPLVVPKVMQSKMILGAWEREISGGDALDSTAEFEKIPRDIRSIYWSTGADDGYRIVVREISVGWRGDMYSLYLLDSNIQKSDFVGKIDSASDISLYQPVIFQSWRPPLVFKRGEQGAKWFIDVGQPFEILGDWKVYTSKSRNAICTIAFHSTAKDPIALLPKQVVALSKKFDEALGPGVDEGTLQQTARTRLDAEHVLANAALRPWALADGDAYNTRSEVDSGLEEWAKVNRARRRLCDEIKKTYPIAEHALASYYASAYGLQPQKAKEMAAWALDLVYRSYFVFSKDGDYVRNDGLRTNPWPMGH